MLSLHLLQLCLVYIDTLMIQQVLHKPQRQARMHSEDLRALTPSFTATLRLMGRSAWDMNERLVIETDIAA
jgi:Tn3 transposase DDE domain